MKSDSTVFPTHLHTSPLIFGLHYKFILTCICQGDAVPSETNEEQKAAEDCLGLVLNACFHNPKNTLKYTTISRQHKTKSPK